MYYFSPWIQEGFRSEKGKNCMPNMQFKKVIQNEYREKTVRSMQVWLHSSQFTLEINERRMETDHSCIPHGTEFQFCHWTNSDWGKQEMRAQQSPDKVFRALIKLDDDYQLTGCQEGFASIKQVAVLSWQIVKPHENEGELMVPETI